MLPPSQGAEELAPAIYATPLLAELKIKVCSISTEFKYKNVGLDHGVGHPSSRCPK
jgi:hypothetical protein